LAKGLKAEGKIGFKNRVKAIAQIVSEEQADLLIVGSHGHHNLMDIIFGETVNSLRHKVKIPVLIAQ
jgi:manganese transport protein